MANVYFKYEETLKFSVDNINWKNVTDGSTTGGQSGDPIVWMVSDQDTQLEWIKVTNKTGSGGGYNWKDTWNVKPTGVGSGNSKIFVGVPKDDDASKGNPSYFAYDIQYKLNGESPVTIDPKVKVPEQ